jgi:hypothetical protein
MCETPDSTSAITPAISEDRQTVSEGRKEAWKTYLEQTKLLVTLASAFLFAPAALIGILKERSGLHIKTAFLHDLLIAEFCLLVSVVAGYVTIATVAGSQDRGDFDVFRFATRVASLIQFGSYILGVFVLLLFSYFLLR